MIKIEFVILCKGSHKKMDLYGINKALRLQCDRIERFFNEDKDKNDPESYTTAFIGHCTSCKEIIPAGEVIHTVQGRYPECDDCYQKMRKVCETSGQEILSDE